MMLNDVVDENHTKLPRYVIMEDKLKESKIKRQKTICKNLINKAINDELKHNQKEIDKRVDAELKLREISNFAPNDSENTSVLLTLPTDLLCKLREYTLKKYESVYYYSEVIKEQTRYFLEENEKQQHVASLSYNGNTKIRKDVLLKFDEILSTLKAQDSWPEFSTYTIKNVIILVLETRDDRTINKYLESIDNFLKQSGDSIGLNRNSPSNLSPFSDAIENKLSEIL